MDLQQRIDLFVRLGEYMENGNNEFQLIKEKASRENPWFVPEFIDLSIKNISGNFLNRNKLNEWVNDYKIRDENREIKTAGIVMAGNIPLVGFHDLLSVFISGNKAVIKTSSKDEVLIKHLVQKMFEWEATVKDYISFASDLKGCDAYIATGSNNSGRYFEYYFAKYPSIIRKNKTSAAILDGTETIEELAKLADDMQLYYGLGCRNITKLYVPVNYDFLPLLDALKKYDHFMEFHKYKNNYDYQLTLLLMNRKYYMTNGSVLFTEEGALFAPVSQVNFEYYEDRANLENHLRANENIQCIVGHGLIDFGKSQLPVLNDYADGIDTMKFLCSL
jgi:hypothetical protein